YLYISSRQNWTKILKLQVQLVNNYGLRCLILAIHFGLKYSGQDVESVSWIPVVLVIVFAIKLGLGFLPILLTFMKMMYHCIFL
ncbi:hypothetical protein BDFB_013468, partial [Asbolus verrucosus]